MKNISLIIPAKNELESLGKTIREILSYKFVNEIIVVVDSKNDNSINAVKKYDVKIVIQKKKGLRVSYNRGF